MSVHNLEIKYTSGRIKSVMVYRNPNKAQIENLFKTAPIIRTLKDNNIHYAWDADLATHGAVAGKLGLSYNHEKGHCHRAHAKSFDIAEIHSNHRVDKYNKEHVILTFKQFITEILDNPYEYSIKHTDVGTVGQFKSHTGEEYVVGLAYQPSEKNSIVIFGNNKALGIGETGLERNHSHRVFSTIQDIIKQHVDKHNPDTLSFMGAKSKQKLYTHLAKRSGHKFTQGHYGNFTINLKEEELKPKIHYNSNLDTAKTIAKGSNGKQARYVLMKKSGELRVADAFHFEHRHLKQDEETSLEGFVNHEKDGTFTHKSFKPGSSKRLKDSDHSFLSKMKKYDITNLQPEN